jgi:hypothetical protein
LYICEENNFDDAPAYVLHQCRDPVRSAAIYAAMKRLAKLSDIKSECYAYGLLTCLQRHDTLADLEAVAADAKAAAARKRAWNTLGSGFVSYEPIIEAMRAVGDAGRFDDVFPAMFTDAAASAAVDSADDDDDDDNVISYDAFPIVSVLRVSTGY